ncbi:hypothetical protein FACS1894190_01020 [Spirochaetia bacterium]|nr:hypothetical protein FACS1894190_01020 [Spirochaetia bacterium]
MNKLHLVEGILTNDFNIEKIFSGIHRDITTQLETQTLLDSGDALCGILKNGDADLERTLVENNTDPKTAKETVMGLSGVFSKEYMLNKLEHELGSITPFVPRRFNLENNILECYKPLGVLCHVAAGNSPGMGALSVLEGLLSGNINIVKLSSKENGFSAILLHKLILCDKTGILSKYIYALDISSKEQDLLKRLFDFSTAVVAWGGTDAIDSVRNATSTPVIAWGHHLSFAYLTAKGVTDKTLENLARDICEENQQACASPQCLFYEGSFEELPALALRLKDALAKISPLYPLPVLDVHEAAQITQQNIMVRLGSCMDEGDIIEADDKSFRIYINREPAITPSPLFRTIWLKPMQRHELVKYIMPMSRFMQTVSLGCAVDEVYDLSEILMKCGATRIVSCGNVFASYAGEPHDGVFALSRYCKRISIQIDSLKKIATFDALSPWTNNNQNGLPIMDKDAFMATAGDDEKSKLYVKSGGSSGKTILSSYSYRDYHFEMSALAESLVLIGLEPKTDRVINLLSAGHLYGGFISYSCILELANAKHFPMAEVTPSEDAANAIIEHKINVIMGMPSYILKLFRENEKALAAYRGVQKIFFGGEFLTDENKGWLNNTFGVQIFASMGYGSNDVGPMGYACSHCSDGEHHLLKSIMDMEIVKIDSDEPVEKGETGRILVSPKYREGRKVSRYEIGDLGCWIDGQCECGSTSPRFRLMGRYGDIIRIAGCFLDYRRISGIITSKLENTQVQLVAENITGSNKERLIVRTGNVLFGNDDLVQTLNDNDPAIAEALSFGYIEIILQKTEESKMEYAQTSGKLKHIIDKRIIKSPS